MPTQQEAPQKKSMDLPSMNLLHASTDLSKDSKPSSFGSVAFHINCILQLFPSELLG